MLDSKDIRVLNTPHFRFSLLPSNKSQNVLNNSSLTITYIV